MGKASWNRTMNALSFSRPDIEGSRKLRTDGELQNFGGIIYIYVGGRI
jgi:hypothetical protein